MKNFFLTESKEEEKWDETINAIKWVDEVHVKIRYFLLLNGCWELKLQRGKKKPQKENYAGLHGFGWDFRFHLFSACRDKVLGSNFKLL